MSSFDPWAPEIHVGRVIEYMLVTDSKERLYVCRVQCWDDDSVTEEYIGPVPQELRHDPTWPTRDYGWTDPSAPRPQQRRNARRWPVAVALPDGQIRTEAAMWDYLTDGHGPEGSTTSVQNPPQQPLYPIECCTGY